LGCESPEDLGSKTAKAITHPNQFQKRLDGKGVRNVDKKAPTQGTMINASGEAPNCLVTAVLLAIAVRVFPKVSPAYSAEMTATSWLDADSKIFRSIRRL